jgi:hypothetical protein
MKHGNEVTAIIMTSGRSKYRPAKGADFLFMKISEFKDTGLQSD